MSILFNGNDHRCYVMPTSEFIQTEIIKKAHVFYQHLDDGTLYNPIDIETMAAKYNRVNYNEPVTLDNKMEDIVNQYNIFKQDKLVAETEMEKLQMQMIEALADNEIGQINSKKGLIQLERKVRNYKPQPEKFVAAKEGRSIRAKTVTIKNLLEY